MQKKMETDEEKMAVFLTPEVVPLCLSPSHLWSTWKQRFAESPCQVADLRSLAVCASLGQKGLGAKSQKVTHCIISLEPFLACTDLLLLWVCYYYKKSFAAFLCSCKLDPSVGTK